MLRTRSIACGSTLTVFAALLVYLSISLSYLTVYPKIGEDEPWIAAAPYKLATTGVWGSDLFAGYYGMERHYYAHMPVYPLLQAAIFKVAGVGVLQMRLLPVAFGLALLGAVFLVGRQLRDSRTGAIALVLMVGMRIAVGAEGTGILLLDRARINRYDIAVPVFGLLALYVLNRAEESGLRRSYWLAGALAGLSSLSHLYGAAWLPVFVLVLFVQHGWRTARAPSLWFMIAGFVATWLPWLAYAATGWRDYLGQMRAEAPRFDFFNPSFYVTNALYGDGPISLRWTLRTVNSLPPWRVGTWTMLIATPVVFALMIKRGRQGKHDPAFVLALSLAGQLVLFALLLKIKTLNDIIAVWPLSALSIAWLGARLWDSRRTAARLGVGVVLALVLVEGAVHVRDGWQAATHTSSYDWFESEVARCIPPGSRILGFQHYWLGLRQYPYRTWLLPVSYASPSLSDDPVSFDRAIERVSPTAILVDRYFADLMAEARAPGNPNHHLFVGFERFKASHQIEPACVIHDPTYGTMQVYVVRTSGL